MFYRGVALTWLSLLIYRGSCERVQLTCDQVRLFVNGHNWNRFDVASGFTAGQPMASNMQYMVWDEELAEKAARWAENFIFMHNPDRTIRSQRWSLVGENLFLSTKTSSDNRPVAVTPLIREAIESWFNEHFDYGFQPTQAFSPKLIGHYTQMVWASTDRIGCGVAQRKVLRETKTMVVCNYGPAGNIIGQRPYQTGRSKSYLLCTNGGCKSPYGYYC